MPLNLRLSLTIFSIGFAVEGSGDAYRLFTGTFLIGQGQVLFYVSAISTALGFLFLWLGRHEWNELHRQRVGAATWALVGVIVVGILAAAPPAYYAWQTPGTAPAWVNWTTGAGVAAALFLTFVVYQIIVSHLVARAGRAVLAIAVLAVLFVSIWFGLTVATNLPILLANLPTGSGGSIAGITGLVPPILAPLSWLAIPYFLFLAVYIDAHRRAAAGTPAPPSTPASA
jgi:hypothetical protein